MKVSVIVPVYNVEKYLAECLDSIINQTEKDIEIIAINDGSTDSSNKILEEYSHADKRITVISQENKGPSAARNVGIRAAKGEYILFCDADDYLDRNTVEILYGQSSKECDLIVFQAIEFGKEEWITQAYTFYERIDKEDALINGVPFFEKYYNKIAFVNITMMLIKKEFIDNNELLFKEGILHEDLDYYYKIINANPKIMFTNKNLYYRRRREESITTSQLDDNRVYGKLYVYCSMMQYVKPYLEDEYKIISMKQTISTIQSGIENCVIFNQSCINLVIGLLEWCACNIEKKNIEYLLLYKQAGTLLYQIKGIDLVNDKYKALIREKIETFLIETGVYDAKKIAIWGTGKYTDLFWNIVEDSGIKLSATITYLDSYVKSREKEYRNLPVYNYKDTDLFSFDRIIVTSKKYEKEIISLLEKIGYDRGVGFWSYCCK